jgi:hypothetical protein
MSPLAAGEGGRTKAIDDESSRLNVTVFLS